jgi:2-iminobutanoate/2-iminopropanoate deaminase
MATREQVTAAGGPPASGSYSQGIRVGDLVFLSGQGPFDSTGALVDASFAAQARQVFTNLETVAQAAGSSLKSAVRVMVYLSDLKYFDEMDEVYREFLGDLRPARSTIQSNLRSHTSVPPFDIEADAIVLAGG